MPHYSERALVKPHLFKTFVISIGRSTAAQLYSLDCSGEGKSPEPSFDKKIVSEDCEEENMVCGVGGFQAEHGFEFDQRSQIQRIRN